MQYITKLDKKKLGLYENKLITEITLMELNKRTWKQTIRNRGKIIWKKLDKDE